MAWSNAPQVVRKRHQSVEYRLHIRACDGQAPVEMRRIRAVTGVEHKLPGGRRQRIGPKGARSHDKAERVMQVIEELVSFAKAG